MDTSTAIFLFVLVIIALGITALTYVFKYMVLAMIAGLMWVIIGITRLIDNVYSYDVAIAITCMLIGIAVWLAPAYMRKKEIIAPQKPPDYRDTIIKQIQNNRKQRSWGRRYE